MARMGPPSQFEAWRERSEYVSESRTPENLITPAYQPARNNKQSRGKFRRLIPLAGDAPIAQGQTSFPVPLRAGQRVMGVRGLCSPLQELYQHSATRPTAQFEARRKRSEYASESHTPEGF